VKDNAFRLSIILPCCNVEKYIAECLDSLYNQDIPETDYEIICVNDCSPDGTRDIIVEYQKQHKNLILIDHKINKRQGGARNTGANIAQGEYIWFIDPDDFIVPNCLNSLLTLVNKNELDLLLFDYEKVDENGISLMKNCFDLDNQICAGKTVFVQEDWGAITSYCWARIVKRSFFLSHSLFFYDYFRGEDVPCGIKCFLYAEKTLYIPQIIYFYRQHLESFTNDRLLWEYLVSIHKQGIEEYKIALVLDDDENLKSVKSHCLYKLNYINSKSVFKQIVYLPYNSRAKFYERLKLMDDLQELLLLCNIRTKITLKNKILIDILHFVVISTKKLTNIKKYAKKC
jgi:glycosyltransferase involved in cell wall biosynthesis